MKQLPSEKAARVAATEINRLHRECCASMRATLEKAIEIGKLLAAQKKKCGHGKWEGWVKANLTFSASLAWRYMRCFENKANLASVQDMTIAEFAKIADVNNKPRLVSVPGQSAPLMLGGKELPKVNYGDRPAAQPIEVKVVEPPRLGSPIAFERILKENKDKPFTVDLFRLLVWEIATASGLAPVLIDLLMSNFEKTFK